MIAAIIYQWLGWLSRNSMTREEYMTSQPGSNLTSDDKLWAFLGYIPLIGWILAILALIMDDKKGRPFIKFHAIQSLILTLINGVVASILSVVVIGICTLIVGMGYMLYIGYKAYQGESMPVPFVSDFIKKQGWA
jgi:uncharacterized membrane protein